MEENKNTSQDTQNNAEKVIQCSCESKTPEQLAYEKQMKTRRTFRILAICVAIYYFASAGWSYYQEQQLKDKPVSVHSTISDPKVFRESFNAILDTQNTSLPMANANDTTEGFVAVLSPSVEMRGFSKDGGAELKSVQIQTRYEGAMPPESVIAFRTFVAACEGSSDFAVADQILQALDFIPEFDKNADNKIFENLEVKSQSMVYKTSFTGGQLDELTLTVSPISSVQE